MRLTLNSKVTLFVSLALLAVGLASTAFFARDYRRDMMKVITARGTTMAEALSRGVAQGIAEENLGIIQQVRSIVQAEDVLLAQVYSSVWLPIDSYPDDNFKIPPDPEAQAQLKAQAVVCDVPHQQTIDFYAPVFYHHLEQPRDAKYVIGYVRIRLSTRSISAGVQRSILGYVVSALLIALATSILLHALLRKIVLKPLERLNQAVSLAVGSGTFSPVPITSDDELGELSANFNRMLTSIQEHEHVRRQLQEVDKLDALGVMAGGVAHDFNNMLAAMMSCAELLQRRETDPKRLELVQTILTAAKRSSELTGKLLAFGRRGKNRVTGVGLTQAVDECLTMLKSSMHPDLRVTCDLEPGLSVDGDPTQINQVLVNLCINAMEAMPGRGRLALSTRRIQLDGHEPAAERLQPGPYAELKVSDTGSGMDEAVLQKLFEPFYTTKSRQGEAGTGLGLATVYGIVDSHKGLITVASSPGEGSTFTILLPLGCLAEDGPAVPQPLVQGHGLVLVVDDEPLLREGARGVLESLGYTVETAQDGQEGVAVFRKRHQELEAVLLDLKMPIMDGKTAFRAMHELDPSVPVIVCTGYGENEEVQAILNEGGAGLLAKPYRIHQLADALKNLRSAR